jgi:hypothetical protein
MLGRFSDYVRLGQDIQVSLVMSGYYVLGQVCSVYVRLSQVKPG